MNILLVAAEFAPYLSSRPSAESVAHLAKALRLLDHSVTVVVPRDPAYLQAGLMAARRLSPLSSNEGNPGADLAHVYDVNLTTGVRLSLVDLLTESGKPRDEGTSPESAEAHALRLRRLGQAIGAYVTAQSSQGAPFDVVHAHDCELGLALLSVKEVGIAKVFTVHDASQTGTFPRQLAAQLGLSDEWLTSHGFGAGEEISLLKGLLSQADAVLVPSENYGKKLQAPEHHGGMARAFQAVSLIGIPEGVDQSVYNPATDSALSCRYDAARPESKGRNRAEALRRLELAFDPERPIVFCEFDALGDPGWSTLVAAIPALMRANITLILAGGDELAADTLTAFPDRLRVVKSLDATARRQTLAAADFYLSVRRKDPSGRALMQASRYGAIPIAYQADAVPDLLVDCDPELETGNGLLYETMTQRALLTVIARALRLYRSPRWTRLLARVMRRDLAWDRAARRHVQVYTQLLSSR